MCDKELLAGYLYDELDDAARRDFETHMASCSPCRDEVRALRKTRTHLATWTPPEPDLAFQIVGRPAGVLTSSRWHSSRRWALAAAAVLVLAAASALANVEVRYGSQGLVVRTGWGRVPQPVTLTAPPPATAIADAVSKKDVQAIEERLRGLEAVAAHSTGKPAAVGMSDAELLRQVRQLVQTSEGRQQHELALRVAQLWRDVETARRVDLAQFQQALQRSQGYTNMEVARHGEMINQLYRVTQQR